MVILLLEITVIVSYPLNIHCACTKGAKNAETSVCSIIFHQQAGKERK